MPRSTMLNPHSNAHVERRHKGSPYRRSGPASAETSGWRHAARHLRSQGGNSSQGGTAHLSGLPLLRKSNPCEKAAWNRTGHGTQAQTCTPSASLTAWIDEVAAGVRHQVLPKVGPLHRHAHHAAGQLCGWGQGGVRKEGARWSALERRHGGTLHGRAAQRYHAAELCWARLGRLLRSILKQTHPDEGEYPGGGHVPHALLAPLPGKEHRVAHPAAGGARGVREC